MNTRKERSVPDTKGNAAGSQRRAWVLLFAVFVLAAVGFSFIQALGMGPDEAAHVKYIKYIANEGKLPIWDPIDGGKAGYETQHPPLFYALGAVVYRGSAGLPENWRWQFLRWYTLAIGIALFWVVRGMLSDFFRGRSRLALISAAGFMLTPLTIEYSSYTNPDIMSTLWSAVVLWMCLRVVRGTVVRRDRVCLSIAFGFGLLTKLTAIGLLPVIIAAHVWEPQSDPEKAGERDASIASW